jgi:hypothetical protein
MKIILGLEHGDLAAGREKKKMSKFHSHTHRRRDEEAVNVFAFVDEVLIYRGGLGAPIAEQVGCFVRTYFTGMSSQASPQNLLPVCITISAMNGPSANFDFLIPENVGELRVKVVKPISKA